MNKVLLRNTDLRLSCVCLGCASFGDKLNVDECFAILDGFSEAGGNFLDTANLYGKWLPDKINHSERVIGAWLKSRKAYGKMTVATKGAHYDLAAPDVPRLGRRELESDLDESLASLGLERIGFYWLHRDDETRPIEDIIDMMEGFRRQGKIRYYGASNFRLPRVIRAVKYAAETGVAGFSAVSNQWSLAKPTPGVRIDDDPTIVPMTDEFAAWHEETKMPAIPFSASAFGFFEKLNQGSLPDRLKNIYMNEHNTRIYKELLRRKEETGASLYALSLSALRRHGFDVIPISSVRNTEQLRGLLQAGDIIY